MAQIMSALQMNAKVHIHFVHKSLQFNSLHWWFNQTSRHYLSLKLPSHIAIGNDAKKSNYGQHSDERVSFFFNIQQSCHHHKIPKVYILEIEWHVRHTWWRSNQSMLDAGRPAFWRAASIDCGTFRTAKRKTSFPFICRHEYECCLGGKS